MEDQLVTLLQSASCQPLLAALRRKAEHGRTLAGKLVLTGLSEAQRETISDLTGQKARGSRLSVDLDAFSAVVVNTRRFRSLFELVEVACGAPIQDKSAIRQRQLADWDRLWESAEQAVADPRLLKWLRALRKSGWLKARTHRDHEVAERLLSMALEVLGKLPADGVPLPVFASTHLGDAHALDHDRDLGRMVHRAIALMQGLPSPRLRRDLRRTWESVGIVLDELSVTVLSLNLPATGHSLTDQMLLAHRLLGEPCRTTFRHLRLSPPQIVPTSDGWLFVCENPSIVASATERLGANCRPLICLEGRPSLAAWRLLKLATGTGYKLAYHGDFDWSGIRIANQLFQEFGFTPWRFGAASYLEAKGKQRKLTGSRAEALWDPTLSTAMWSDGRALDEEQVLDSLIQDLDGCILVPMFLDRIFADTDGPRKSATGEGK